MLNICWEETDFGMEGYGWWTNPKVLRLGRDDLHEVVKGAGGRLGGVGALSLVCGEQQR